METPTKPTRKLAMMSQCHECLGHYQDGMKDCKNVRCSLYFYMPYRKLEPDLHWLKYNTKRKGKITWAESARELTDEERQEIRERFIKNKKKKGQKNETKIKIKKKTEKEKIDLNDMLGTKE